MFCVCSESYAGGAFLKDAKLRPCTLQVLQANSMTAWHHSFVHAFTCSLARSLAHPLSHSLTTHPPAHPPTPSLTPPCNEHASNPSIRYVCHPSIRYIQSQQPRRRRSTPAIGEGISGGPCVSQLAAILPLAAAHSLIHHAAVVTSWITKQPR